MGTVSDNADYSQDSSAYAGANVIDDSEKLRIQLRQRCRTVLSRLFPEHGPTALGDWEENDVFELTAIFEIARAYRHAEPIRPLLSKHTILRVLSKLATGSLFHDHSATSLIEKEQHLRLLSAALRLYKYEGTTLGHDHRDALYRGINELRASFEDDRRNCTPDQRIENCNVAFLIQHCQYLLVSIEDDESLSKAVVKKLGLALDAGLSAWGSQLVDAKQNVRDIAKRQRSRPKWHDEFMRLEDTSFAMYVRSLGLEVKLPTMSTEVEETDEDELKAALLLRDSMEDTLIEEPKKLYKFLQKFNTGLGRVSQVLFECGSYEENAEYFRYGVLDLMYQLSYRIRAREQCFTEFVSIVKLVLERSHPSATLLHRKAIDLYRRINQLGRENNTTYGAKEDRRKIENWKNQHHNEVEAPAFFEKRSKRYGEEVSKIREKGKLMLILEPQTQAPRAKPMIRQQSLKSDIFPSTPNHVPGRARKPPSVIREGDILEEPFCDSPEPALGLEDGFNDDPENDPEDDTAIVAKVAEFMRKDSNHERVMEYLRQFPTSSPALSAQLSPVSSPQSSPRLFPQDWYPPESSQSHGRPRQRQDTRISVTSASTPSTIRAYPNDIPIDNLSSSGRPRRHSRNSTILPTITPPDHGPNNFRRSTLPVSPPAANAHTNDRTSIGASMLELEATSGASPPHQSPSISPSSRRTTVTHTSSMTPQSKSSLFNLPRRESSNTAARQSSLFAHTGLAERRGQISLMTGPDFRQRTRDTIVSTAISATGRTVAVVTKQRFWVFVTTQVSLVCSGLFERKKVYKYASGEEKLQNQHPVPDKFSVSSFSTIALSDEYLAIGTTEKLMVFAVTGEHSGRWTVCDDIPKSEVIKLAFSPDGKQLVALVVKDERNSYDSARIYSTDVFLPRERAPILQTEALGVSEIQWQDVVHKPSGIAFSQNGEMVAICTTHSSAKADIRILKREVSTWRNWGTREVTVHQPDHREWHGGGLTGISFFRNDEFLVLSVDSSNPQAGDCYQITKERTVFRLDRCENIAMGERGTTNLFVAVSHPYDAVALLNKEGSLQLKSEGGLLGWVAKHPTVRSHDPITISFDESGTGLMLLDHHGNLEVYKFYENRLGPLRPNS